MKNAHVSYYHHFNLILKGAIHELHEACVRVFPTCDHLSKKSPKGFTPHISMGYFESLDSLKDHIDIYSKDWAPIEFEVKEVYFLSRLGSVPYELRKVIPLGGQQTIAPMYKTIAVDNDQ